MSRVRTERTQGVTFVELFFDLVFVYAITQLTSSLLHDLSWAGAGRWAVAFWLVWWAWTQFTWTLNFANTESTPIRFLTLAATAVAFFLAQALPDAYGDAAVWFAGSYVVVRALGLIGQIWINGDDEAQARGIALFVSSSLVGLALVLVGAFAPATARPWFWLAAIVADVAATSIAGRGTWILQAGHFSERHGLIVIIALGESLIAAGVAATELERGLTFAIVTAGAVVATGALWWLYFGTLHSRLEHAMASLDDHDRGRFARDVFSLGHAVIVAGIIGVAVGFEEAVAHPDEPLSIGASIALAVGTAMFAGGLGYAARRSGLGRTAIPYIGFAAVALVSTPIISHVSSPLALWGLAAVAGVTAIAGIAVQPPAAGQPADQRPPSTR